MSGFMNSLRQVVEKTRPRDQILGTVVKITTGSMVSVYLTDGTQISAKCPYDVAEGDQVICTRPVGSPVWMIIGRATQANMSPTEQAENNTVVIIRNPIKFEVRCDNVFIIYEWSIWPDYIGGFEAEVSYVEDHSDANTFMLTSGTVCVIRNHPTAWLRIRTVTHSFVRGQWTEWLRGDLVPLKFTDLDDVPHTYAGHSLKFVGVNELETGLTFVDIFIYDPTNQALILNVADYPLISGQWVGLMTDTVDSKAFTGVHGAWNTDMFWFGGLYQAADQVETVAIFGDNSTDHFKVYFRDMNGALHWMMDIRAEDYVALFPKQIAVGDYQEGDLATGQFTRTGILTNFGNVYPAVGWVGVWDGNAVAIGVVDVGTHKDMILAFRPVTVDDIIRFGYMREDMTGIDFVLDLLRDGSLVMLEGATVDGVDVSAHAAAVNPHATTFLSLADTPTEYTGHANQFVRVTAEADGVDFQDVPEGITTFLGLADTPDSYVGHSGDVVKVKSDASGLELGAPITSFLALNDTPNAYGGKGGQWVIVDPGEGGLAFMPRETGGGGGSGLAIMYQTQRWFMDGVLAPAAEVGGVWWLREGTDITAVSMYVTHTGTSGDTVIDVLRSQDGGDTWATLYTVPANRPIIAGGQALKRYSIIPDVTFLAAGDIIRVDVISAAVGARNLTVQVDGEVHQMQRYPHTIVLTSANTEYPQVIETGAKVVSFAIRGRTGTVRYATETGKVAGPTEPYSTLVNGETYDMRDIVAGPTTFYFASSTAGLVIEMEVWA